MQHDEITFEVEARNAGRFSVRWEHGGYSYWFTAVIENDQIQRLLPMGGYSTKFVCRRPTGSIAAGNEYLRAEHPDAAAFILAATRHIRSEKLATYATEVRDKRLAAQEAALIAEAATRVRAALAQLEQESDALAEALGLLNDTGIIRARHGVADLSDAYLYRLAVILGCD